MKCFRVREVGQVERGLNFQVLDGVGYVPVGGTRIPYLQVAPELTSGQKNGIVHDAMPVVHESVALVLSSCRRDDGRSFVVIPSGGFDFDLGGIIVPFSPPASNLALAIIMEAGDCIHALRKVRSLSEANNNHPVTLKYDGEEVTFA